MIEKPSDLVPGDSEEDLGTLEATRAPEESDISEGKRVELINKVLGARTEELKRKDKTRFWISLAILGILAGVVLGSFVTWPTTKELIPQLLTSITGLAGLAVGYYFGSEQKK